MDENHERFLQHLKESEKAVWLAASWLHKKGYSVKINPAAKAPDASQWKKYTDNGDLEICLRVEVKALSAQFTCLADWPYKDFIVCAKHSFDKAKPKPHTYIYLSEDKAHAAVVMGRDHEAWTVKKVADSRYKGGLAQDFYFTPMDLIEWHKIGSE